MRKLLVFAVAAGIVTFFSLSVREANAERVLTQKQMDEIATTCEAVQAELDLLHASDALLRVNLGQRYENISTSLMSPLNSRLSLNQVDNVALVKTSVDYQEALTDFRATYITYERTVKSAIDMKCEAKPVEFYTSIEQARKYRSELRRSVKRLNSLLVNFQKEFRIVKADWIKANE